MNLTLVEINKFTKINSFKLELNTAFCEPTTRDKIKTEKTKTKMGKKCVEIMDNLVKQQRP